MVNRRFATAKRWTAVLLVAEMGVVGGASATLLDRGPDLVYDDVLNITWTRNANLPGSSLLTWAEANAQAAGLAFAGFDDWRLPWESVSAGVGPTMFTFDCNTATEPQCRDNEMGYMFSHNLGGAFLDDKTGNQTALGGEMLTDIQPFYWSGTKFDSTNAWDFLFDRGDKGAFDENNQYSAWAVRPGDVVAAVPEPATLALLGLGLAGLGFSRRKQ